MKIAWDDIERSTIQGTFIVNGKSIAVDKAAIGVWWKHPDAIFNTKAPDDPHSDKVDFVLAGWELPGENPDDLGLAFQSAPPPE